MFLRMKIPKLKVPKLKVRQLKVPMNQSSYESKLLQLQNFLQLNVPMLKIPTTAKFLQFQSSYGSMFLPTKNNMWYNFYIYKLL